MGLSLTVGGASGTFEARVAREVASVIDNAFGAEGDWEGVPRHDFGGLTGDDWRDLQRRAVETLGTGAAPNLLALGQTARGVYLPAHLNAVTLPLSGGESLRCASLPGLREELNELADAWELPLDDGGLRGLLIAAGDPDEGSLADAPEVTAFARLALAANEAVRKDCPLWLLG